ncbi:MAG: hypothetical protein ACOC83_04075 [Gemmatimonadota bacterium]
MEADHDVRERFSELADDLEGRFRAWGVEGKGGWTDAAFETLSLRAFELQHEGNRLYRRYCDARGIGPGDPESSREVPPVPTAAFREVDLVVGRPDGVDLVFRTSGTSRGEGERGRHLVPRPSLYRASLEATFRRLVLPDGRRPLASLVPPFDRSEDSSLAWMIDRLLETFGAEGSKWLADFDGIDWDAAEAFAARAADEGRPVGLLGTTLAMDAWVRRRKERGGDAPRLPPGSIVMDTGGAKGRDGLERPALLDQIHDVLGVPPADVVNELGMTELLSQRYGRARTSNPSAPVRLRAPPWLRSRALHPVTLEELPPGEVGVLCHHDLANLGSACAVLTEDLGRVVDGELEWVGRVEGSPPRGCSLATAELLQARERAS